MKRLLFFTLLAGFLFSCKKEVGPSEEPQPPATTGNLSGYVNQYDQFGVRYVTGLNTTTVTIDSTDAVCVTDQNGHYSFANVGSGIYTVIFKKPGAGTVKIIDLNYKFTDSTTYNVSLADIPAFSISSAYLKDTSWFNGTLPGIYYKANTAPVNSKATVVAIVGKSPNITLADPLSYIKFSPASLVNTTDYNRFLSYAFLSQSYGFKKDSVIFVKIYPVATTGASYYDNAVKKPIYTAYGTPYPTFTITMPQ
ncbi:MAG: carboxypeptidase-like regulatory domain-containing protein [Bacteroidota bacterium]